jgi:Amt family ammonium transporter
MIPMALLGIVSLLAIVVPAADPVVKGGPVVAGDVAWMMTTPYAFVGSWLLFRLTDAIIPLRVSERQELIGLDITQHDETVSSRGVHAALESIQGELFPTQEG